MPLNRTERLLLQFVIAAASACCHSPCQAAQKPPSTSHSSTPLATAKNQLDHGDVDSAEKTLWAVLSADPTNQEALTMLGVVRGRQQRYAEAEALFRRVLQLNPKSTVATRNLADALLAQDKPEEALNQYKQAIGLNPQDIGLKVAAVQLELSRSEYANALSILEGIKPVPPPVVPYKAASLLGLERKSDAESLIPLVKSSPAASLDLAQVFIEANDPDAALKCLNQLSPAGKSLAARAHDLRGRALLQKGDKAAALASFRQALANDPKSTPTQLAMAELFASENKHMESLRMLEQARTAHPDSPEILRHLVVEAMLAHQNERALQAATDLQRISPNLDDRYLVSTVLLQQKQYVPATHILEDYVAQRPQDAKAYLGLGMAYLGLLRYADAQQALNRSRQLNPNLAETEYQLGLLASQQGNRQDAIQHWEKAVELQPHHAQALFSLGTVFLETGELSKAEGAFERSLASDPTNMKTEYNLSLVLSKLGKPEEAKQHLERYRKMQEEEHATSGNTAMQPDSHR